MILELLARSLHISEDKSILSIVLKDQNSIALEASSQKGELIFTWANETHLSSTSLSHSSCIDRKKELSLIWICGPLIQNVTLYGRTFLCLHMVFHGGRRCMFDLFWLRWGQAWPGLHIRALTGAARAPLHARGGAAANRPHSRSKVDNGPLIPSSPP